MEDRYTWIYLLLLICLLYGIYLRTSRYYRLLHLLPASKAPPIIGHAITFSKNSDEILGTMTKLFDDPTSNPKVLSIWVGPFCSVYLRNLENIEKLLSSNNLKKSMNYEYLEPWLGKGLINSDGDTWHNHRKLINPAFHFKILESFLETMMSKTSTLYEILDKKVGKGYFNIDSYIENYSLDIITETAMSSSIDAQNKRSEFVENIQRLTEIIILRSVRIWYYWNVAFWFTRYASIQKNCTSYVNKFISKMIDKKRNNAKTAVNGIDTLNEIDAKKRLALLDLLFEVQSKNPKFKDKEILDEVNTFMFAGHDTTASGINFVLYLLSVHQDVQQTVYDEIMENLQENITYQDLMSLKYLERVIKESLRLYPSVPYVGRKLVNELKIADGYILPKDCFVAIFIYYHHRNPEIWPNPEKFDPDRFLPENSIGRHPYAYIPFSAGPRNCIGQKFAMMEIMLAVCKILHRYKLIVEPGFKIRPISHIVLRPDNNGVRMKLERR